MGRLVEQKALYSINALRSNWKLGQFRQVKYLDMVFGWSYLKVTSPDLTVDIGLVNIPAGCLHFVNDFEERHGGDGKVVI